MKKRIAASMVAITITTALLGYVVLHVEEPESPPQNYMPKSPPEFTLGLHIAAWTLIEYGWSGNSEDSDWRVNVVQNLDWISRTGYNTLLIDVMEVFADHTVLAWRLDEYQTERYKIKGRTSL